MRAPFPVSSVAAEHSRSRTTRCMSLPPGVRMRRGASLAALRHRSMQYPEYGVPRICLLRLSDNSGTAPIWTPTSGQNGPRRTISLP